MALTSGTKLGPYEILAPLGAGGMGEVYRARDTRFLEGLAWSPDGKEVWFAGASHSGWADSIHAVTLAGKERIVSLLPSVRLHDIARDGRVLLSRESWRTQLMGLFPGDTHEHPYSWLDGTSANAISADGRAISLQKPLRKRSPWESSGNAYTTLHAYTPINLPTTLKEVP